ncbi:hypothetical protein B7Y94_05525 [Candidatus Saccharibacteria bacterium 32-49-12]|nr:MAG: hypothetical protein B7Y94_05525 [Candidatus Saccharibacteria bacterium 32-49-12]
MPPNNSQFQQPTPQGGTPVSPPMMTPQPMAIPAQPNIAGSASADTTATPPQPRNPNSTQSTLQFSEIRDNMVIMADGSFRAIVACKSINYDLMSSREQEGIEYSYQNFLNSLNFPVQILVRSQRVDIGPYINQLVDMRRSQDNMLLGVLMDDYISFIDILSQEANIMEKAFYIVVPYFPMGDANLVEQSKGFFGKLFGKDKTPVTRIDNATYLKSKEEITNRVNVVRSGLFQIGVQSRQLDTKSLGELYYSFYNPDTALRQPLANFEDVTSMYVNKAPTKNPEVTN